MTDEQQPPTEDSAETSDLGAQVRGFSSRFLRAAKVAAQHAADSLQENRPDLERRAREALGRAQQAAESARPEVERLAREARTRAEQAVRVARPAAERLASDAVAFARDHDEELKAAAARAADLATQRVVPPTLRPMVDALRDEITDEKQGTPPAD